jgi:hypothetical protein
MGCDPACNVITERVIPFEDAKSPGVTGEEYEGPHPCSGWRRRLPLPDYFHFDGRLGRTHTSPTSDVRRGSSRSGRGAPTFRGEALQWSRRPWLRINVRDSSIPGQQNFVYRCSPAKLAVYFFRVRVEQ